MYAIGTLALQECETKPVCVSTPGMLPWDTSMSFISAGVFSCNSGVPGVVSSRLHPGHGVSYHHVCFRIILGRIERVFGTGEHLFGTSLTELSTVELGKKPGSSDRLIQTVFSDLSTCV